MLPRISDITHPTGSVARLPKLVPSFSSKGFARCTSEATGAEISRASEALQAVGGTIRSAFLISAFDIFHGLVEFPETYYAGKELIFMDSGGYELSGSLDGTEPREVDETPSLPFTKDNYASVLSRLPEDLPFVVANFDFGTHGMAHHLETVLEAAEILSERDDIVFVLIGDGAEKQKLLEIKQKKNLQNVIMMEQQSKDKMPNLWALSDVSLVLLKKSDLFKTVIPSKPFYRLLKGSDDWP